MSILGIDHIQIAIPAGGEEKARAFFVTLLGFREMPKPPELAKRGGAWLESGTVQLHIGVDADFHPAHKAHPASLWMILVNCSQKFSRQDLRPTLPSRLWMDTNALMSLIHLGTELN